MDKNVKTLYKANLETLRNAGHGIDDFEDYTVAEMSKLIQELTENDSDFEEEAEVETSGTEQVDILGFKGVKTSWDTKNGPDSRTNVKEFETAKLQQVITFEGKEYPIGEIDLQELSSSMFSGGDKYGAGRAILLMAMKEGFGDMLDIESRLVCDANNENRTEEVLDVFSALKKQFKPE